MLSIINSTRDMMVHLGQALPSVVPELLCPLTEYLE